MTTPPGASARNIRFVSRCDQGGRSDGMQVIVHKGHAFIGHMFSDGFSVVDVRDPLHPKTVAFVAAPKNTRSHHLQIHDDVLLAVNGPNIWTMQQYASQQDYYAKSLIDSVQTEQPFAAGLRVFDISKPANPVSIATLPTPAEEDFCAKGAKFGPHNLHENRPCSIQTEDLVFATYHNAGLRIYNIWDAFQPKQIGYFVPPAPNKIVDQRPNPAKVIQSCDVFVDTEGLMYLTDTNAGLYILQFEGH